MRASPATSHTGCRASLDAHRQRSVALGNHHHQKHNHRQQPPVALRLLRLAVVALAAMPVVVAAPPTPAQAQAQAQALQQPPATESPLLRPWADADLAASNPAKIDAGLVNYIAVYRFLGPVLGSLFLIACVALLFVSLATTAHHFFCPNLSSIAAFLALPESVSGVTIAALGNGAGDLFATFAAFRSGLVPLALGELYGAATFITFCVVGMICIVKPSKLPRRPFVRDIVAFLGAATLVNYFVATGEITFARAVVLVCYYLLYVTVVVVGALAGRKPLKPAHPPAQASPTLVVSPSAPTEHYWLGGGGGGDAEDTGPLTAFGSDDGYGYSSAGSPDRATGQSPYLQPLQPAPLGRGLIHGNSDGVASGVFLSPPRSDSFGGGAASGGPPGTPVDPFMMRSQQSLIGEEDFDADFFLPHLRVASSRRVMLYRNRSGSLFLSPDLFPDSTLTSPTAAVPSASSVGGGGFAADSVVDGGTVSLGHLSTPTIGRTGTTITTPISGVGGQSTRGSGMDGVLSPRPPLRTYRSMEEEVLSYAPGGRSGGGGTTIVDANDFVETVALPVAQRALPVLFKWRTMLWHHRIHEIFAAPVMLALTLTTPVVHEHYFDGVDGEGEGGYTRVPEAEPLVEDAVVAVEDVLAGGEGGVDPEIEMIPALTVVHLGLAPLLLCLALRVHNASLRLGQSAVGLPVWTVALALGGAIALVSVKVLHPWLRKSTMLKILSGLGFLLAVLFVATISGELVGLLDAIGTLSGLSPTLLGLTLFAFGNSVGGGWMDADKSAGYGRRLLTVLACGMWWWTEFVTNLSIARMGYSTMALGACYGGPMLSEWMHGPICAPMERATCT
ncbi:Sodium/calcium exchanger protein-domain-containing protein [Entophlyctis helioformis]|nr:Sodium/calcium exchanger protein-domain-containing protein [Entophlyctis helioformis]